ncbi:hypothetical protein C2G38_2159755 [Gigaspora rosea]|uniref:Uncharacterized protein n=1 Tax=Gigaspora rosea TaxID=44941 RepID=A0A397W8T4_9GLOM|nr:hypothetical protein C2G38_2159755 [Gigaspora rosea]
MKQTYSGTSTNDDDEFWLSDDDNNKFWLFNDDNEDDYDSEDDDVFSSKSYNRWDNKNNFGKDALKKLYQVREAYQLLRLFTICLPNSSEQAKNGLFVTFSQSNSFGILEHNALLDALAHPVKGLNLFEYDELSYRRWCYRGFRRRCHRWCCSRCRRWCRLNCHHWCRR